MKKLILVFALTISALFVQSSVAHSAEFFDVYTASFAALDKPNITAEERDLSLSKADRWLKKNLKTLSADDKSAIKDFVKQQLSLEKYRALEERGFFRKGLQVALFANLFNGVVFFPLDFGWRLLGAFVPEKDGQSIQPTVPQALASASWGYVKNNSVMAISSTVFTGLGHLFGIVKSHKSITNPKIAMLEQMIKML